MIDVVAEFLDAIVDATADGEPLESFQNNVHADPARFAVTSSTLFPVMILHRSPPTPVDIARGSRYVVHQGAIFVGIYEPIIDDDVDAAANLCETHRANLERVLLGLRALNSGDYPTGVWSEMGFELVEAGGGAGGSGPFDLEGIACYQVVIKCDFRFVRERAA